jgi:hypothetical protein
MTRQLISHSEVDSFVQCERKHAYAHIQKLQPKARSEGISRGNAGHKVLEVWAKALIEGDDSETALVKGLQQAASMPFAVQGMALATEWVRDIFPGLGWKIVAVEVQYRVQFTETLVFPFKFDLLIECNGELWVVDHKFLYDFYTQQMINIFPQTPKYIFGLRKHGINVVGAKYNMLRTRKVNKVEDRFCIRETRPNEFRIKDAITEQMLNMRKIEANEANPQYRPMRSANKMNCGHCGFADLCEMEARGEPTQLLREAFYEPNEYGYEDD